MFKNLPTMLWVIGATVAVAAFSPAVGNVTTSTPPVVQPPAVQPPAVQPPAAKPSATPSPTTPSTDAPVVIKAGTTKLGPTAVNAEGFTVYLSVLDSTDPPRSVC